mmetsp:Transcript_34979/g.82949  ORF Transcript_34979/g.82949 Transcript_34979/m.82949 type:complete len:256 (+) Transcript_34979:1182-1949(+)
MEESKPLTHIKQYPPQHRFLEGLASASGGVDQRGQAPARAQVHLDEEVAILLPGPVVAHDVGMGPEGSNCKDLPHAPLAVPAAAELPPRLLDRVAVPAALVPHCRNFAVLAAPDGAEVLKVVLKLKALRAHHTLRPSQLICLDQHLAFGQRAAPPNVLHQHVAPTVVWIVSRAPVQLPAAVPEPWLRRGRRALVQGRLQGEQRVRTLRCRAHIRALPIRGNPPNVFPHCVAVKGCRGSPAVCPEPVTGRLRVCLA